MSRTYPNPLHTVHPSIAVIIGILSIMFSMTFLLLAYAKLCHTNPFNIFNRGIHHQNLHALSRSRSRFSGIDKTVIESLPFFRFSSLKGSKEGLECAVCISKFEDTEVLRLLPKCKHAFHLNCIDQWLESHSSCPLCRYKFDLKDLTSFTYSSSLRFLRNPSNLSEDPNLELFVQRQPDLQGSSRFSIGGSFRKTDPGKEEELLIQEAGDLKQLHKFKHKIIIADVVIKNRWSDVNPSDLLFLNSEMINVMSSKRFSPSESNGLSNNEQIEKIKEDMERKRLYESKFGNINESFASTSNSEVHSTRQLNPAEKRSMSDITNVSRFRDYSMKSRSKESPTGINGKEERIRRIWLPIARQTVKWFAGRERSTQELEIKRQSLNV